MATGAIANINFAYFDAQSNELFASSLGIEISNFQTEMVKIMGHGRLCTFRYWPETGFNFLKVDQRVPGAHMDHAKVIASSVNF